MCQTESGNYWSVFKRPPVSTDLHSTLPLNLQVVSLGWPAGEYERAALPKNPSAGPVPPMPAGPSGVELGVAEAARSP